MAFNPIESYANRHQKLGQHGGVNMSIEASTTFNVVEAKTMPKLFTGEIGPDSAKAPGDGSYFYGRNYNPTVLELARGLAALEGTEDGHCTSSGLSAILGVVMQLCDKDDHIVAGNAIYGGTFAMFHDFLPGKTGLKVSFVDINDLDAVEAAFTDRTKILYCETQSNPTLVVANVPRLAEIAHRHGVTLVVDNTFSPMVVSPAQHGADVVVHSLTKFISGASDIIGGAILGSHELMTDMANAHTGSLMIAGPTMDPRIAFELSLRLPHLGLRVAEHSRRAQIFAERLVELGVPVNYPGLPGHAQHEVMATIANEGFGFGGIFGVDLGTMDRAYKLMEKLQNEDKFGYIAVSLGYFDTLMSCSASSTSSELSEEEQRKAGISPGLVRVSIGYTGSLEQRWEQFHKALEAVGAIEHARV